VSLFSGFADEESPELLFTAATPALARVFADAVVALPGEDVPDEIAEATRAAAEIFADTAGRVEAAGVDPQLVGVFEQLLSSAAGGGEIDPGDGDLAELLDDDQRSLLADIAV